MKRYDITKLNDSTKIWQEVTQDPEGVWIQYSDYEEEVKKLIDAAIAYRELNIFYRLGKKPTEKLFKKLNKAGKILEEAGNK